MSRHRHHNHHHHHLHHYHHHHHRQFDLPGRTWPHLPGIVKLKTFIFVVISLISRCNRDISIPGFNSADSVETNLASTNTVARGATLQVYHGQRPICVQSMACIRLLANEWMPPAPNKDAAVVGWRISSATGSIDGSTRWFLNDLSHGLQSIV